MEFGGVKLMVLRIVNELFFSLDGVGRVLSVFGGGSFFLGLGWFMWVDVEDFG